MLERFLGERKAGILDAWRERIAGTYPDETARRLLNGGDPFSNPGAFAISKGAEGMLDWVLARDGDAAGADAAVEDLVRIRAIQEFAPSEAVGFVFALKDVLRREMADALAGGAGVSEWLRIESRIDALALAAFDAHARCRDEVSNLRVEDFKRRFGISPRRTALAGACSPGAANPSDGEGQVP